MPWRAVIVTLLLMGATVGALIGFGVFLMLTTLGVLPWSFWLDVARLWPVLLIGMGLRLIFERSAMRWAGPSSSLAGAR